MTGSPRSRRPIRAALALLAAIALGAPAASSVAAPVPPPITGPTQPPSVTLSFARVASGLAQPLFVTHAGDGSGRLFIVEKVGRIRILRNGSLLSTPFLDIRSQVSKGGEQGLLGLAFHPDYRTNGRFFVSYTNTAGDSVVREYRRSSTNANRAGTWTRVILKVDQPYANHNGGHIAFGPDGFLYIGLGDGGSAGDPGNRAQSLNSLLGKILRIDINGRTSTRNYRIPSSNPYVGRTGRDEIWSRGLRNPWRFSFDRSTGDLWIGDVGQSRYEEIDRMRRTSSGAGRAANFGWRVLEGRRCYKPATGCSTSGKIPPLIVYSHSSGRCSVTGGYVYRGPSAALRGLYLFGDYCTGEIWSVRHDTTSRDRFTRLRDTGLLLTSFGEAQNGELYAVDGRGSVYRVRGS